MSSKTREKLIDVARQLFAHKGVAHTTMNDIANAAAKGRRTIYTYFKNKREIYNAVLEEESEIMVDSLRDIARSSAPVEERLAEYMRLRLKRYYAPSATASFKAMIKFDSRRLERVQKMARQKENAMMTSLLAEGVRDGTFSADRCRLLAGFLVISETVNEAHLLNSSPLADYEQAINEFIEFVITDITIK